jgi:hypothetical protein
MKKHPKMKRKVGRPKKCLKPKKPKEVSEPEEEEDQEQLSLKMLLDQQSELMKQFKPKEQNTMENLEQLFNDKAYKKMNFSGFLPNNNFHCSIKSNKVNPNDVLTSSKVTFGKDGNDLEKMLNDL